jgi:ubiquinone/menaquinone biosynthesis C-methylase UbiE
MNQFSEGERQLLIAIAEALRRKKTPDEKTVEEIGKHFFENDLADWNRATTALEDKGLVQRSEGGYALTDEGRSQAHEIHHQSMSEGFSEGLNRHEQSRAYSEYCRRLYGKNLCQFNMMDMEQLETLLELLELRAEDHVLDLGCGIGTVTEFISDRTGAHVTGVDFAPGAIARAQERTKDKCNRLAFVVGDMNSLEFPEHSFDTVIAIDTLYFVEDLGHTVGQMKRIVSPQGQMGLFFSQKIEPKDDGQRLLPQNTDLARALKACRLPYRTWDFTRHEHDHWRRSLELAEELKSMFEEEGNLGIYKSRIEEGQRLLKMSEEGRSSRFLYHVHV